MKVSTFFATAVIALFALAQSCHANPLSHLYYKYRFEHFYRPSPEEKAFFQDAPPRGVENDTYTMLRLDKDGTYYTVRAKNEIDPKTGNMKTTYFDPETHQRVEDITEKEFLHDLE